jgi:hypothetical protein
MGQIVETMLLAGDGRSATNVLLRDPAGNALLAVGKTIPANSKKGYAIGCEFVKTNAANGQTTKWINRGTATSCGFRPLGPVIGYGFNLAGGPVTTSATPTVISLPGKVIATDISFAEQQTAAASLQIISQITSAGAITIAETSDPSTGYKYHYATLREGCVPEYDIFAAGTVATVGGAAAEAFTVAGVLASDIAFATYSATDDTDTIDKVVCTANTITCTFSTNPGATHGIHYVVIRPRGSFKPSHYVFAAKVHTTLGGAAAEAVTVTGALASDVCIVKYASTNDTDTILKAVMTADTCTITMSANPVTDHSLAIMVLRAY